MPTLLEGQKFGRCRVHRYLGRGSSGESYEAEDIALQRKVILKLIHPWSPLPDASRRQFFREVQDISALEHAYLAAILDYGEYNGHVFLVRRYIGPGSLLGEEGRYWYRPPLAVPTAIHLAHQLAQALHTVHMGGYAHGSLTMTNIQVLRGPQQDDEQDFSPFLITDIGLAYFARRFGKQQSTFFPVTAAPEQLGGRTIPASDQYALAVILYFWLTGLLPFVGSPDMIEQQKLSERFTSPEEVNAQVTPLQAMNIRQALSVYPEDRHSSIIAFTSALEATLKLPAVESQLLFFPQSNSLSVPAQSAQPSFSIEQLPKTPAPSLAHIPDIPLTPLPLALNWAKQDQQIPQASRAKAATTMPNSASTAPQDHLEEMLSALLGKTSEAAAPSSLSSTVASSLDIKPLEAEPACAYLVITSRSNRTPHEIKLEGDEITIGRAGSSHILLDQDTLTSRHQAKLQYEQGNYLLYDLRSAYGTRVNGQQLSSEQGYLLHDGDKIHIGSYELVFIRKSV